MAPPPQHEEVRVVGRSWRSLFVLSIVAGAAPVATACDPAGITDAPESPSAARVAYVGQEGGRPALFVQNADGTGRTRIHFVGARELPGNPDVVPPVEDAHVLALAGLAWSPDGRQLAVVVTLAYDQSEVVVVNADGTNARVASLNTQIIMTTPDWSPDGTRLAYGMSTIAGAGGVQLFVTDLAAGTWRQVTKGVPIGSAGTDARWSTDGGTIYLWRTLGAPGPDSDWLARISSVDAATGAVRVLADSVAGMVQEVGRGGTWALVIRQAAAAGGQPWVRDLVRRPLVGLGPEVRLAQGNLMWARASWDDRSVTVVSDQDPAQGGNSYTAWLLPIGGGKAAPLEGLDRSAFVLDVSFE